MQQFKIQIPQADIDYLQQRLQHTRWSLSGSDDSWERGVPVTYLQRIAEYWGKQFDWKRQEEMLNRFPQFLTEIDGQNIHFLHVRSGRADATPLMLVHGWPGSFVDFIRLIEPLTNPSSPEMPAFHVVIPSIPGFGFSIPVKEKGWNMIRIANAFTTLMKELGYDKFAVHGGDMGAGIVGIMSGLAAYNLVGTHINSDFFAIAGLGMFPTDSSFFSDEERICLERMKAYKKDGTAYLDIQATRPQTIGIALSDSPVAQLAWILEKIKEWSDADKDLPHEAIDIDQLLTNVSLYWYNQLGASSADILAENMRMAFNWGGDNPKEPAAWTPPKVPSAVACFGKRHEEALIKKLLSFMGEPDRLSFYEKGCHFPAMETPEQLINDLREFFKGK